jgi:hypothetical protein
MQQKIINDHNKVNMLRNKRNKSSEAQKLVLSNDENGLQYEMLSYLDAGALCNYRLINRSAYKITKQLLLHSSQARQLSRQNEIKEYIKSVILSQYTPRTAYYASNTNDLLTDIIKNKFPQEITLQRVDLKAYNNSNYFFTKCSCYVASGISTVGGIDLTYLSSKSTDPEVRIGGRIVSSVFFAGAFIMVGTIAYFDRKKKLREKSIKEEIDTLAQVASFYNLLHLPAPIRMSLDNKNEVTQGDMETIDYVIPVNDNKTETSVVNFHPYRSFFRNDISRGEEKQMNQPVIELTHIANPTDNEQKNLLNTAVIIQQEYDLNHEDNIDGALEEQKIHAFFQPAVREENEEDKAWREFDTAWKKLSSYCKDKNFESFENLTQLRANISLEKKMEVHVLIEHIQKLQGAIKGTSASSSGFTSIIKTPIFSTNEVILKAKEEKDKIVGYVVNVTASLINLRSYLEKQLQKPRVSFELCK